MSFISEPCFREVITLLLLKKKNYCVFDMRNDTRWNVYIQIDKKYGKNENLTRGLRGVQTD